MFNSNNKSAIDESKGRVPRHPSNQLFSFDLPRDFSGEFKIPFDWNNESNRIAIFHLEDFQEFVLDKTAEILRVPLNMCDADYTYLLFSETNVFSGIQFRNIQFRNDGMINCVSLVRFGATQFSYSLRSVSKSLVSVLVILQDTPKYSKLKWSKKGIRTIPFASDRLKYFDFFQHHIPRPKFSETDSKSVSADEDITVPVFSEDEQGLPEISKKVTYQMGATFLQRSIKNLISGPVTEVIDEAVENSLEKVGKVADDFVDVALLTAAGYGLGEFLFGKYSGDEAFVARGVTKLGAAGIVFAVKTVWKNQDGLGSLPIEFTPEPYFWETFKGLFEGYDISKIKKRLDLLTSLDRASTTLLKVMMWVFDNLNRVCQYLFSVDIVPRSFLTSCVSQGEIREFLDRAQKFADHIYDGSKIASADSYTTATQLYIEGSRLLGGSHKDAVGRSLLNSLLEKVSSIKANLGSMDPSVGGTRVEPVCVMFRGGPGVFKSKLTLHTAEYLRTTYSNDPAKRPYVYNRNPSQVFYDNYVTGTKIMIMDDFGQSVDVPGQNESECMSFIKIVNTVPCMLNMASLNDKGRTYCQIDYCLSSTNLVDFRPNSIVSKGALDRRINFDVIVFPREEYCENPSDDMMIRKLDKSACPKLNDDTIEYNPDFFSFYNKRTGEIHSYQELLSLITARKKTHDEHYEYALKVNKMVENQAMEDSAENKSPKPESNKDEDDFVEYFKFVTQHINFDQSYRQAIVSQRSILLKNDEMSWKTLVDTKHAELKKDIMTKLYGEVSKMKESIHSFKNKIPESNWSTIIKYLAFIVPVISVICASSDSFNPFKGIEPSSAEEPVQMEEVEDSQYQSVEVKVKGEIKKVDVRPLKMQMGYSQDPSGYDRVKAAVRRNQFTLTNGSNHYGFVLAVTGSCVLMNKHFRTTIDNLCSENPDLLEGADLTFTKNDKVMRSYVYSFGDFLSFPWHLLGDNADTIIVEFPSDFETCKNLVNFFKDYKDAKAHYNTAGLMCKISKAVSEYNCVSLEARRYNGYPVMGDVRDDVYVYKFATKAGDCGALLIDFNPRVQSEKIIGIHSAGDSAVQGMATPVYKDQLKECLSKCSKRARTSPQEMDNEYQIGTAALDSVFTPIARVEKVSSGGGSSFMRSPAPFFEMFGPATEIPTNCNPGRIMLSLVGYNPQSYKYVDSSLIDEAIKAESDFIYSKSTKHVPNRILSEKDIVFGMPENPSPQLNRKTSPGYPYVLQRGSAPGKTFWLGSEPDMNIDNPQWKELMKSIDLMKKRIISGERLVFPFMMHAKDEIRKIGKPPRLFGGGPISCLILCSMYFGAFVAWYQANLLDNGSTLGINVFDGDWESLARKMGYGEGFVLSGDFSGFDKRQDPKIIVEILNIIERFYSDSTEEDRIIRRTLFVDCYNPHYFFDGVIYQSNSGLPSGHFLTSTINTLFNRVLHRMAYATIYNDFNRVRDFDKVPNVANGDDSLTFVSEEESKLINEESISKAMTNFSVIYTSDTKDGTFALRKLWDIHYLKRSFRKEDSLKRVVGPLKLERLLQFPNFTRRKDPYGILREKLDAFIRELSIHEKEVFDKFFPAVEKAYVDLYKHSFPITDYYRLLYNTTYMEIIPFGAFQSGINLEHFTVENEFIDSIQINRSGNQKSRPNKKIKNNMNKKSKKISDTSSAISQRGRVSSNVSVEEKLENFCDAYGELDIKASSYQMDLQSKPTDDQVDTIFANSKDVDVVSIPQYVAPDLRDADFINGSPMRDISHWLGKPTMIATQDLDASDGPTTFALHSWSQLLNTALIADKLDGVFSFQADLEITVTCNGNPFQLGLYCVYFLPSGGDGTIALKLNLWNLMHAATKTQITQLPHVKIDVSQTTEAKLIIPWKSAFNSTLVGSGVTNVGSPGSFRLVPLVPLVSGPGSSVVGITIFARYTNVKLGAVTIPQSGASGKKVILRKDRDILTRESDGMKVSDTLRITSIAADYMSKIPLLSSIAGPASFVLGALSKTAAAFGFSKPTLDKPTDKYVKQYVPGFANMDGSDGCESLSTARNNHVGIHPEYLGSDIDEMSFDFLKQIPAWRETIEWNITQPEGTILSTINIDPGMFTSTVDSAAVLKHYVPMGLILQYHDMWRGDIILKIHIVKTQYHSGRLIFCFQPVLDGESSTPPKTTTSSQYLMRTIADIREDNYIELRIPYVSITPWIKTGRISGKVEVLVLDQLVCPSTVPSEIYMFVEACGADNLQFASPRSLTEYPVIPSAYQSGISTEVQLRSDGIGGASYGSNGDLICSVTQGESIKSFRQWVKRYFPFVNKVVDLLTNETVGISPFCSFYLRCNGTIINGVTSNAQNDLYSVLSGMYAFSRGGVRISIIPTTFPNEISKADGWFFSFNNLPSTASNITNCLSAGSQTFDQFLDSLNGTGIGFMRPVDFSPGWLIPQNSSVYNRINALNVFSFSNPLSFGLEETDQTRLRIRSSGSGTGTFVLSRSGGDDCTFGCFVSVPPFVVLP
jgi:hypothetical protein